MEMILLILAPSRLHMIERPAKSLTRSRGGCEGWGDIVKLNWGRLPGFQFCIYHIML